MALVIDFLLGILISSMVLAVSSKLAWIQANLRTIVSISTILAVASLVPKIGLLLCIALFFYLVTMWLGATGMEALYMGLMNILLHGTLALLVLV